MTDKESYPPLQYVGEDYNPIEITSKPTDKEIIQALECCISDENCESCPLHHEKIENACILTVVEFYKEILALINRRQAEIDGARIGVKSYKGKYESAVKTARELQTLVDDQQAEIERLQNDLSTWKDIAHRETSYVSIAKAEAIKELLDKIEKQAIPNEDDVYWVELDDVCNLVKEMVGEQG